MSVSGLCNLSDVYDTAASDTNKHCILYVRSYQGIPLSQSRFRPYPQSARALSETPPFSQKIDIRNRTTW